MRGTERSGRAEGQTQRALAVSRRAGEAKLSSGRAVLPVSQLLKSVMTLTAFAAKAIFSCSWIGGALGPSSRSTFERGLIVQSVRITVDSWRLERSMEDV